MDIEICIDNIESALIAQNSGADRLEVCGCLALGGVTPPYSLLKTVLDVCNIPCYVMIRPRSGDFLFNSYEIEMMEQDIHIAKQLGAQGVVIGALTENGEIDLSICHRLISAAEGLGITFHRAFDLCIDPYHGLEQLIELGCERVLTSGQKRTAFEGTDVLRTLVQQAKGRIRIMAGAGINPNNALELAKTGKVDELHLSAKTFRQSSMKSHSGAMMGNKAEDDYRIWTTDRNQIIAIKKLFQE
ncbi:copper homeostasis protein CutC [Actinobacillus seminis]|uniref:copper homeostasis protein CutC n=1 Tax=Actinobacillus seminis TaxID=722 RepID=UPI003B955A77